MILRRTLLYLSEQKHLRHWMETSPLAGRLTSRFVAGRTLDEEIEVCRALNRDGYLATLDRLGESITSLAEAADSRDAYLEALARIESLHLDATVSIKPSQFGLALSEKDCRENVRLLVERACGIGTRVEIDMEGSEFVDSTLNLVRDLHERYGSVRAVIQAYLYRSADDVAMLCSLQIPVRLCKGAYREPASIAFPNKSDVDANYLRLTRVLMRQGVDPAIATHDPRMIDGALSCANELQLPPGGFEFQMLYGIRRDLQQALIGQKHRLRLYVPYGIAWYPYFMRRLAERPANLLFLARNLLRQ
jgi:proline dehydrogenase